MSTRNDSNFDLQHKERCLKLSYANLISVYKHYVLINNKFKNNLIAEINLRLEEMDKTVFNQLYQMKELIKRDSSSEDVIEDLKKQLEEAKQKNDYLFKIIGEKFVESSSKPKLPQNPFICDEEELTEEQKNVKSFIEEMEQNDLRSMEEHNESYKVDETDSQRFLRNLNIATKIVESWTPEQKIFNSIGFPNQ